MVQDNIKSEQLEAGERISDVGDARPVVVREQGLDGDQGLARDVLHI